MFLSILIFYNHMRPKGLMTRIFLDSGNPHETRTLLEAWRFLDGQTTNPTLVSKSPGIQARCTTEGRCTEEDVYDLYKGVVQEIARLIPDGSVSVEVYADQQTRTEEMLKKARAMFSWIPNAHIKFPTTAAGLEAASQAIAEGMRVNMTLCFSQDQAAAVYAATKGAKKGQVFVSPFVGRLDDRGKNGMDLIANIVRMYRRGDGHVEVLTASVRNGGHLLKAFSLGSDIVTAPYAILKEWGEQGMPLPDKDFQYHASHLKAIPYVELDLDKKWQEFDIFHELTDAGIEKFSKDWNKLIQS